MTLEQLLKNFRDHEVVRAHYKWLSSNDNSKNQIYLGSDFSAINVIPFREVDASPSAEGRRAIIKCPLTLSWVAEDGRLSPAPGAQLILYPQYPEVRLSGILTRAEGSPSAVIRNREKGRILVLGVTRDSRILAYAGFADGGVARGLPRPERNDSTLFHDLVIYGGAHRADEKELLLTQLARIHRAGWIDAKRLDPSGAPVTCEAMNAGGLTLEAELGIIPNATPEPDFHGWEIKQYGVRSFSHLSAVVTLMTPEPDGGYYHDSGPEAFVRKYGYLDKRGRRDRMNFGGLHRVGLTNPSTRLKLALLGFDNDKHKITDPTLGIALLDSSSHIAALWQYKKLIHHWSKKHAHAAYVPSIRRTDPRRQYRYGGVVHLGEGVEFIHLLVALVSGFVYYDPGIKLEDESSARPRTKRRSQFRIHFSKLPAIYVSFGAVDLSSR